MIYTGENEYPVYLGENEIPAIYCGEELIYPVNLGTLTGITIENLAWVEDVPYSGGTVDKDNCSYKVVGHYDSGKNRSITSKATITGSISVSASTATERVDLGLLELTATFEGFTATASTEAYQEANHYEQYLTFRITSPGKIVWFADSAATFYRTIQYSLDSGATWNSITAAKNTTNGFDVVAGDVVMLKGETTGYGVSTNYAQNHFAHTTAAFDVEGNIMSLLYGGNFAGQTVLPSAFCLRSLWDGVASGAGPYDASNLIIPATVLTEGCYRNMFAGCEGLTTAPPQLPATTLATACYANMFINCANLEIAPDLPAPTLVKDCYNGMLYVQGTSGNRSRRYIKCLATNISASGCTTNFHNSRRVSLTGTFVKAPGMTSWQRGNSGIPANWTVVDNNE